MFNTTVYASNLDDKGNYLLGVIRNIGYWIVLFMGIKDVIKEALNKDI